MHAMYINYNGLLNNTVWAGGPTETCICPRAILICGTSHKNILCTSFTPSLDVNEKQPGAPDSFLITPHNYTPALETHNYTVLAALQHHQARLQVSCAQAAIGQTAHSVGPCPRTLVCHSHVRACTCALVTHAHFGCPPRPRARMSLHAHQTAKHILTSNLPAVGHGSNTQCHKHCHVPYPPHHMHNIYAIHMCPDANLIVANTDTGHCRLHDN